MEASATLVADPMPATAGRRLGGSALAVTVCSVAAQVLAVGSQSVVAKLFGAGSSMDAYLAANTLPQYVVAVLLGALGVVFVPVFLEFDASGRADEAWTVASAVVTMTAAGLIVFAVAGVALAEPLLRLTTPGLSEPTLRLAARIARVTWPSMAAAGITGLLTGMYHAKGRFGWPAVIPVMGAALNLALVVVFAQAGVIAVAVAGACSVVMQTVALAWGLAGRRRLHASFRWMQPGVAHVLWLMWPLALSNIVIRYTPVVDRYLASSLPEGAIRLASARSYIRPSFGTSPPTTSTVPGGRCRWPCASCGWVSRRSSRSESRWPGRAWRCCSSAVRFRCPTAPRWRRSGGSI
jgi:putative peptidoglycan lipid II flippase